MRAPILLACLLLAGCVLFARVEVGQSAAQVRAEQGEPTRVLPQADGGELWQYATQPSGTTFINVRFDPSGRVAEHWDAFDEAHRARIRAGMSAAEVDALLGPHRTRVRFPLSGETVLDWNISNIGNPGLATYFNVHLRDGVVVRTSISYEYIRDGFGMGFGSRH